MSRKKCPKCQSTNISDFEWQIDSQILDYTKKNPNLMAMKGSEISWDDETFEPKLSAERIAEETKKIMSLPNASESISLMKDLGILNHVFLLPDNAAEWELSQINPHHYENVWDHTITVMKKLNEYLNESESKIPSEERFELNMAAFLHDSGKLIPETGYQDKLDPSGQITRRTFVGHPKESTEITNNILNRLRYPNKIINNISNLVRLHDEALNLQDPENSDYIMMKLIKDIGKRVYSLLPLAIADRRAHIKGYNDSSYLEDILNSLPEKYDGYEKRTKTFISGNEIQSIMGANPGKWIGILISFLEESQMKGYINSSEEAKDFISKVSIVCKKINKVPDEWISQILPYLLNILNDETAIVDFLSSMSNRFKGEDNKPIIEKYITGNDIISLSEEMGIPIKGQTIGKILSEALAEQMAGQFIDENGNPDKSIALNWLVERIEQEKSQNVDIPQKENHDEKTMNTASSKKWYNSKYNNDTLFVFSERNQKYSSPTSIEEDRDDDFVEIVIEELGEFLLDNKKSVDWERIADVLDDDTFMIEIKKYFELDPKDMYEFYVKLRDDNIQEHVAAILDSDLRQAQAPNVNISLLGASDFDTSELDSVFGSDIVNAAKQLAISYNPSLFSNIVKVTNEGGDFLGVFKPGVTQQIVENLAQNKIISEEQTANMLSGSGLIFSINPERVFSEKEGIKNEIIQNMMQRWGMDQNDSNFKELIDLDDKHLLILILGEAYVHESIHASGNPEMGYPGEGEAESGEKSFLSFAIQKINLERESKGIEPLEIGIK